MKTPSAKMPSRNGADAGSGSCSSVIASFVVSVGVSAGLGAVNRKGKELASDLYSHERVIGRRLALETIKCSSQVRTIHGANDM
jgi:hypothetical protein